MASPVSKFKTGDLVEIGTSDILEVQLGALGIVIFTSEDWKTSLVLIGTHRIACFDYELNLKSRPHPPPT